MQFMRAMMDEASRQSEMGTPIRFLASTEGVKRDGINLRVEDWYLNNYRRNPVVLWVHDYFGRQLPIGRAEVSQDLNQRALVADVTFDQGDEFAREVERKYRAGYLHTVSVGWNEIEIDRRRVYDLLDISAVPVPGDPDALMERMQRGLAAEGWRLLPEKTGDGGRKTEEATEGTENTEGGERGELANGEAAPEAVGQTEEAEASAGAPPAAVDTAEMLRAIRDTLSNRQSVDTLQKIYLKVMEVTK
jgi:hypothetical protein